MMTTEESKYENYTSYIIAQTYNNYRPNIITYTVFDDDVYGIIRYILLLWAKREQTISGRVPCCYYTKDKFSFKFNDDWMISMIQWWLVNKLEYGYIGNDWKYRAAFSYFIGDHRQIFVNCTAYNNNIKIKSFLIRKNIQEYFNI